MPRHIALLRGINLGARNRIRMADLRELLSAAGYAGVRTHLQSGNVLLDADAAPAKVAADLERRIADAFDVAAPIIVRTRDELAEAIDHNPLAEVATEPKLHQVSFFAVPPDPDDVRELLAADVAPEAVAVHGRELYAWHPDGMQGSALLKLPAMRRLAAVATARNWRTVLALRELADSD
jgi:uncharacterized protein (DUF1697 family)